MPRWSTSSWQDASGFDLIAAMRERVPDLPVVAISGLAKLDAVARSAEVSNVVCLQKPFRPVELIRRSKPRAHAMQGDAAEARMARLASIKTKTPRRTGAFDVVISLDAQEPFGLTSA